MALSRIVYPSDGVTTQFAIPFALGYINESDIKCQVANEVDGFGAPVYRALTFNTPTLVTVAGAPGALLTDTVFTRTVTDEELIVDFEDGAVLNDENLNTAQKQALMLVHQVLDGRFATFLNNIDMGGFKLLNMGTPTDPGDGANKAYVDSVVQTGADSAAAAAASAVAAASSAGAASGSAAASAASASASSTSAGASQTSRLASEAARDLALTYRDNAYKWSSEAYNVAVNDGTNSGFSAFHWATVAQAASLPMEQQINAATSTTIVDADSMGYRKASDGLLRKQTWAQLKSNIFGTQNTWSAVQDFTASISVKSAATNTTGIEIGRTDNPVGGHTAFFDFHTGATSVDYDSRFIMTGGTGVSGGGNIAIESATVTGSALGTGAQIAANVANKLMGVSQYWAYKALSTTQSNVTGNVSLNFAASDNHYLLAIGNVTLNAAASIKPGQDGFLRFYNPANWSLGFNAAVYKTNGNLPISVANGGHSYFALFMDPTDNLTLITPVARG